MDPSYPVAGVGCWSGGVWVRRRHLRSGRVSSRRDPSDDQVSLVVDFSTIPLCRRGAGAYIVGVVGHPYLTTLLPLWLTMPSYTSTTPAVLAVRHASIGKVVDLTCVRSAVRPLGIRPYLCQVGRTTAGAPILASDQLPALGRPRRRAGCPRARGCGGQVIICPIILSPREDLLEAPDKGAKDEVWCLAADPWWL
ncbi:hypothetical protein BHE74_00047622 [Ensete ventricosum]|nr:hypothetical protein GW17_00055780 [Ensete ventricosum]RWW46449.1 hypothetical protein BHE74_00047622 [Ensete ventricosum]